MKKGRVDMSVSPFKNEAPELTEKSLPEGAVKSNSAKGGFLNNDRTVRGEELQRTVDFYQKMVEEVQDYAIILLSPEGIIKNWNIGAEKIKGYMPQEIIGKNFHVFYSPEDQKNKLPDKLLEEAARQGSASYEGWRIRKDGSKFWGSIVITALHDDNHNIFGFSKVTRDLTEKKAVEEKLKNSALELDRKNKILEQMNQELSSFAYVSSHDLQEPLRKIQTFSTRILELENDNLSERGKDYFERLLNAAKRMQILIDDLLTYSRTNTDERKVDITDLNEVLEAVKNELKEKIDEKNATIKCSPLPTLEVVSFQFHQLFINLIGNSIKFSKVDVPPQIMIEAAVVKANTLKDITFPNNKNKSYHHLTFTDNGIGFEPDYNAKIFEVFQRLHGRNEYSGTGIGLAICKKIVENHGGIITAEGEPEKGAIFHIYLPT